MALEAVLRHTGSAPGDVFTFCDENFAPVSSISYHQLGEVSRVLAEALLRSRDRNGALLKPGDRVVLVFMPSIDFIVTFIACIRAGLVAVPVYPPDPRNLRVNISLFTSICSSCGAKVALSHSAYTTMVSLAKLRDSAMSFLGRSTGGVTWPELTWLKVDGFKLDHSDLLPSCPSPLDASQPSDLAFLQYTSGSTSEPKGVRLTHGCLAANIRDIISALRAGPDTVVVSWLPQYHDMGLIGSYLALASAGGRGYYASPLTFIKRPMGWLQAISRFRATHVQAPNFAYALCARKLREHRGAGEGLDLSSLRHCFNAAEPVTAVAIRDFYEAFAPHGFRPAAMAPGYGLAEQTVFVCVGGSRVLLVERQRLEATGTVKVTASHGLQDLLKVSRADVTPDRDNAVLVSCGPVWPYSSPRDDGSGRPPLPTDHIAVVIVEPEPRRLIAQEDRVGEVWVSSDSTADGYFNNPGQTEGAFGQELLAPQEAVGQDGLCVPQVATEDGKGAGAAGIPASMYARVDDAQAKPALLSRRWLRTGDLGFVHGGQLYIAGRLKDLLILRGRNFYPADIEGVVELAEPRRLRPGCTAVFATESEGAVLAAEVRPEVAPEDLPGLARDIRTVVAGDFGIRLEAVVLCKPRGVQKTTSGKVARRWNARAWAALNSEQPEASPWAPGKGLVLMVHRAAQGGDEDAGAEAGADRVNGAAPGGVQDGSSHPTGSALVGKDLLVALRRDAAVALGIEPPAVDTSLALSHLGLDSLALMQFQGRLASKYGLAVRDDLMWDQATSLRWLVTWAEELRKPLEAQTAFPLPGPTRQAGAAPQEGHGPTEAASTGPTAQAGPVAAPPVQLAAVAVPVGHDAPVPLVSPTGSAKHPAPARAAVPLVSFDLSDVDAAEGPGQARQGRRRKGPSAFEQNCPCLLWCVGK